MEFGTRIGKHFDHSERHQRAAYIITAVFRVDLSIHIWLCRWPGIPLPRSVSEVTKFQVWDCTFKQRQGVESMRPGSSWLPHQGVTMGAIVGALVTVGVTIAFLYVAGVYRRRRELPMSGPWPWPVVGNLPVLGNMPHRSLQKLAAKYGGLMYLQLGQKPCLVVSSAAAAKELFKKHDAAFASRPPLLSYNILTAGVFRSLSFAPYGPFWRQMRRVANSQLFSPAVHSSHEGIRKGEIHNMMRVLVEDSQQGESINLKSWLTSVTANNMTMMFTNNRFFGTSGVENQQKKKDFEELMRRTFAAIGAFLISDFVPYLSFFPKLQGWVSEIQGVRELGVKIISKIIEVDKHRELAKERDPDNSKHVPDFVDVLLKAPLNDGDLLPDRDIVTLIVCLMNAGTDTSATTVEWGMAELMANPDIRKQAQAELDAVVGQDRLFQESDIPNLPFLQAIVKETYRLHPSVPLSLRRESHEPCVISGYQFPAHTELILNIFAIHRDPSVYENPDEFRPRRFLEHPEVDPLSGSDFYQLVPFGAGRRMCPGHNLANVLVTSMLANLLHCFDWALPGGASAQSLDMADFYSFMSFRKSPLSLLATPRPSASLFLPPPA